MPSRLTSLILPLVVPALFLWGWETTAVRVANDIILPRLGDVLAVLAHPLEPIIGMGSLVANVGISLARVLFGYLAAVALAIPLGILMGYFAPAHRLLNNFLSLFRPIPPLAWTPLMLAWFGITSPATVFNMEIGPTYIFFNNLKFSMAFIIFIGGFFPVLTSSVQGVRSVRRVLVESSMVLGASRLDIFRKVILPAASPSILTGMRIGLGVAWMCLISAEMLPGSMSGVGYLITHAYTVGRQDIVITGMVSIGVMGALMDQGFRLCERRMLFWRGMS
ncbi:MAG: ABC transporter permease [Proteobacteria bacterium]|nr:ABC transporter permease [Pseudomonadota bacterium]MBU1596094.1 ABC transporter permease [Pseudomonadota bacterium]